MPTPLMKSLYLLVALAVAGTAPMAGFQNPSSQRALMRREADEQIVLLGRSIEGYAAEVERATAILTSKKN